MADEDKEKATLIVTSVGSKREPSAGNPVITFSAHKEGEEAARGYETWGNELVDQVVKDAKLNCEITQIQKGDAIIHRVTQMFDASGNPMRQARRRSSSGGGYYGKTDEQIRVERMSIEGQTAYNGIIELRKANAIPENQREYLTALDYAEMKMRASMAAAPAPKKEEPKPKRAPEPTPAAGKAKEEPAVGKPGTKITPGQISQLKDLAEDKGYESEVVSSIIIRVFKKTRSKDLTWAEANQLIGIMREGKYLPKETEPSSEQEEIPF